MKRFLIVATMVGSIVGFELQAGAARRCRPTRRTCAGVTHQPCAPAALRAAPCKSTVMEEGTACVCAFWQCVQFEGYNGYYGGYFFPDCNTATWVYMEGNYSTNLYDPCPTCAPEQCESFPRSAFIPGGSLHKPGIKANRLSKWDAKLVLKSGTGRFKRADGTERVVEFESKEFADARMLISFHSGNAQYFAKLHSCRVEVQETGAKSKESVFDFGVGQEIEQPPADQKVRDVTNLITIAGPNVANVKIGNTVYQIVTMTPLAQ